MNINKLKLTFLLLITLLPILLATWYYSISIDGPGRGTTNKGVLLDSILELSQLQLKDSDGKPAFQSFAELTEGVDPDDYEPRPWQLLFMAQTQCDESCLQRLYMIRQIHIRLGKESGRVRRVFVIAGEQNQGLPDSVQSIFTEQQPDLRIVHADAKTLKSLLEAGAEGGNPLEENYIYVADPLGNIMLYFTPENTAEEIFSDIDKLLDHSSLG